MINKPPSQREEAEPRRPGPGFPEPARRSIRESSPTCLLAAFKLQIPGARQAQVGVEVNVNVVQDYHQYLR